MWHTTIFDEALFLSSGSNIYCISRRKWKSSSYIPGHDYGYIAGRKGYYYDVWKHKQQVVNRRKNIGPVLEVDKKYIYGWAKVENGSYPRDTLTVLDPIIGPLNLLFSDKNENFIVGAVGEEERCFILPNNRRKCTDGYAVLIRRDKPKIPYGKSQQDY